LDEVSKKINAPSIEVWFEGAIPVALESETLILSVPNDLAREYIETRFSSLLEASLRDHLSPSATLKIQVRS
jgi:chromosomal replication initiator protein